MSQRDESFAENFMIGFGMGVGIILVWQLGVYLGWWS